MATKTPKLQKSWLKRMPHPLADWHLHQGNTNDCGPFCATMAANAMRNIELADAPTLARTMEEAPRDLGNVLPARIKGWATFPWGVVYALKSLGLQARWRMGASLERLQDNLDEGMMTIVIVGDPLNFVDGQWRGWAHYKLLYAWHPENGWAFVDPMAAEGEAFSYQDDASFREEWTWMGRHIIEVWDEDDD